MAEVYAVQETGGDVGYLRLVGVGDAQENVSLQRQRGLRGHLRLRVGEAEPVEC